MKKIITKASLVKELKKPGLSYHDASMSLDILIETITESLSKGESVQLRGFGTFCVKKQAARKTSINGNSTIPEHGRVIFRPCENLRKAVWHIKES